MKNNIQIDTLSQVHVGSGVFLQEGNDFIVVDSSGVSDIYVIDTNKLGAIIGTDRQLIDKWVTAIERGEASSFIKTRTAGHHPRKFAKRRITNFANFTNTQGTLKECLHDGMGRPYIPGSSIKGAIRTAVMATYAKRKGKQELANEMRPIFQERNDKRKNKMLDLVEKGILGSNPNVDLFRFIKVGDAFFDNESEVSVKQINLNIRQSTKLIDKSKQQIVEAIGSDVKSSFSLKIDTSYYNIVRHANHRDMAGLPEMPDEMSDVKSLFELINEHTKDLVEKEIRFWNEDVDNCIGQEDYVANLEDIMEAITSCRPNQCVLRLGQAIGWRFITGAWTETLDEKVFYDNIVPLARYKNEKYSNYVFPKSRRIDDESFVFGFLKLTYNP